MEPEARTPRRPFPILPGLGGLLRGELSRWVGRRGLVHLVLWTLVIQGALYLDTVLRSDPFPDWRGYEFLIHLWWVMTPLAAIAISQNALIEERRRDTAPWVLSKPVSRSSFLISKILGDAIGLSAIAVVLQGVIAFVWLPRVDPALGLPILEPDLGRYLVVLGVCCLIVLFFVAMTVSLTTFLPWRAPVAAVGLSVWVLLWISPREELERYTIGGLVTGELESVSNAMKPIAEYLVFDQPLQPASSVAWTALAAVAFTVLGALVFRREQF